jgi:hypothetical protein
MSDLRKPFYDYANGRLGGSEQFLWAFAEWALEYMSDSTPERAYAAFVKAMNDFGDEFARSQKMARE